MNDRTPRWGGRFAGALKKRWPSAQEDFIRWVSSRHENLKLGNIRVCRVESDTSVISLIAQRGYGESKKPRIRYGAFHAALAEAATHVKAHAGSVHAPRLGVGQAGGQWPIVEEMLTEEVVRRKIPITIYDLPSVSFPSNSVNEPKNRWHCNLWLVEVL